ncbi:MAG: hypothetical protein NC302_08285 [Bacteroidales bacterium]|nr:hypothetical protein [Bacteroidales bacterium]MCM1415125.1 hypothetical protein [bacterium]MCM1423039.1 hypothetical protein [bacterium]
MKKIGGKMAQWYRRLKARRDDRGSAIVIVIIAMAMIGILATTLLWMSYMNYMIKLADIRNKNSFYTAEEVVEQIMSGLRRDSAEAVGIAYRDVLANWDNLDSEEARNNLFMTTYLDTLIEKYKHPTQGSAYYDRSILEGYVDAANFPRGAVSPAGGVDVAAWDHGNALSDPVGQPEMELANNNSIILKNIYVSCTADDERVSIVKTDICLDAPKLIFENRGSIDGLYQYSLIGNAGIDMQVTGPVKVEGSIYAGTDALGVGGLQVGKSAVAATTLTLEDSLRVISKGDIRVDPASSLSVRDVPGEDNRVYARNITLNSAAASLDSKVYVANDLTLDGTGSRVSLTKEYYGYGTSTYNGLPGESDSIDSAASSAIIINGKNSTVDMSSVTRLLLAGRSYIGPNLGNAAGDEAGYAGTPAAPGLTVPKAPVMMGESIAIKGGQVAYLVPAECIGTLNGESEIGQNPINADKENDITDFQTTYGEDFKEVDFTRKVYRLGGHSLSEFGVADMNHIRKVYAPYRGGSLLYYYLVMDKSNAERYFVQYYDFNANREEIDTYFNRYLSGGFQLGDFADPKTQYTILGNSLVSSALSDSGVTLLTGIDQTTLNPTAPSEGGEGTDPAVPTDPDAYTETGINADEVVNEKSEAAVAALTDEIRRAYKSLTFDLTDDGSINVPEADPDNPAYDPAKASEYVFNSVIKTKVTGGSTDNVEDYLDDNHVNQVIYETSSGLKAVLSRSDVSVSGIGGVDPSKLRLLVCLGDVTVDHDFTGLIIAKGKITVTGAHTIKRGGNDLANVLEAESTLSGDTRKPIDMFTAGGGSLLNGAEAPDVDGAGNLVLDYSELVRYMNWIKK